MKDPAEATAKERAGKLAGAMFLFINATGIFSEIVVRGSLLSGDVGQVARNISSSERLYRLGIAGDLVTFAGVVVLVWALYVLLEAESRHLVWLAVFLRLVEVPVGVLATAGSWLSLQSLGSSEYLKVFEAGELHALSRLARGVFGYGQDVGFIFIGLGSTVFAYLLFRSRYVPRIIAIWGICASALLCVYNLTTIVIPNVAASFMLVALAPMGVYEIGIGVWLVMRGPHLNNGEVEERPN